ncbi:hypothetical protein [Tannockella kyphosi]|uniref:hypothetical protein n=1 Tax=Tannockella kyphosi TaxID=2899121 RepID=UPI002011075B|nr:hypothetical protein [Tannockella kyphosi]
MMARIYKTIRFAYETKYWIDRLIARRTEQLQKDIRTNGLQDCIEEQLLTMNEDSLDGISINISLNVTVGSIIEMAVRSSRNLTVEQWNSLSQECEIAKRSIEDSSQNDSTPRIYISENIYRELEDLQSLLRQEGLRVPRMSYVIKLAVYHQFKNIEN